MRDQLLSFGNTVVYAIMPKGEAMLAALRDHARAQRAPHRQLGAHLAQWLAAQGRMTWEDTTVVDLGSSLANGLEVRASRR